jgi:hypothetical protein
VEDGWIADVQLDPFDLIELERANTTTGRETSARWISAVAELQPGPARERLGW